MQNFKLTFKPYGERSLLIEWPQKIDENTLQNVVDFKKVLQKYYIKQRVYINNAYNSILVFYVDGIENIYDEISVLKALYDTNRSRVHLSKKLWKIPVCYDPKFGWDLDAISSNNNLKKEAIIDIHSGVQYTVYFIGFLPGFLYLGGLDKQLFIPRKATPRLQVDKGAVAIGGSQTGVYPHSSPGGWNIIGNSPIDFFNLDSQPPCFASPGDKIMFYSIGLSDHTKIIKACKNNTYVIESEVIDA